MPLDPLYLSAGLGALCMLLAAVAAVMQGRLSRQQAELSLLDERLSQAMLAQEGLGAQLETSRLGLQRSTRDRMVADPAAGNPRTPR